MRSKVRLAIVSAVSLFAAASALTLPALGEVGAAKIGTTSDAIILEPEGGAPSDIWLPVRPDAGSLVLWPEGAAQGDLRPDLKINPATGQPEAVWPTWDGSDFELAWSRFDGEQWLLPLLLTDNSLDDLEVAIDFGPDGALAIVFRRDESISTILYLEHDPQQGWSPEIAVSDGSDNAYMPSVALVDDQPRVGYHELPPSPGQTSVIVASGGDGPDPWPSYFTPELVALTSATSDLQQETLAPGGLLYTVWIHDSSELRFCRFRQGAWGAPEVEAYEGPDDLGRAKIRVKARVVHDPL